MADFKMNEEDGSPYVPANKKLTIFVIDGSEKMFSGGNECDFRKAVRVAFSQILNICCSGSLNHMVGVVVTNTKETDIRTGHKHCYEWVKLTVPGSEEALALKNFLDSDNIHNTFLEKFGGHEACNLAHSIWGCRKIMQLSATSIRHHMIMYFTNESNPFKDDKQAYDRFKKLISDFTCTSYRDRNGLTKIVKTPGEFHLALLGEHLSEKDRKRWEQFTPMIFNGKTEELETQAYKKTFSQRAFSMLSQNKGLKKSFISDVEIAPGVKFGVGVYLLAGESRLPTKQLLDAESETKVEKRTAYVPKELNQDTFADDDESVELDRGKLKKSIKIGGQEITTERDEITKLSYFDAKKIVLLGFKALDKIDLTTHLQPAQLLYPDDTNIRGSVSIYSGLLERCLARKMAMICRFCARANQKVRLVALVPQKKLTEAEMLKEVSSLHGAEKDNKLQELRIANDFKHNGFVVVFLPYAEDKRNLTDQMQSPVHGGWPKPSTADVSTASTFVEKLTKPFTPESYFNPRMRSFNSMLIEASVGEQIPRVDSLAPYYKRQDKYNEEAIEKLKAPLVEHFDLDGVDAPVSHKRTPAGDESGTTRKRAKVDLSAMTTQELIEKGMLDKLTVAELKAKLGELKIKPTAGAKKADLIEIISAHFS